MLRLKAERRSLARESGASAAKSPVMKSKAASYRSSFDPANPVVASRFSTSGARARHWTRRPTIAAMLCDVLAFALFGGVVVVIILALCAALWAVT